MQIGVISAFFKSRKKSVRAVRVVLTIILLMVAGQLLHQGYNLFISTKTRGYINLPIIKKEIIQFNETDECYQITNEKYRVYCWINHYVPYKNNIDTSFIVYNKGGSQVFGPRNERILIDYFRKEFLWRKDKKAMIEYFKEHLEYKGW